MILGQWKYQPLLSLLLALSSPMAHSTHDPAHSSNVTASLHNGYFEFQLGNYWGTQGKQQHINIQGLIGDNFSVSNKHSSNGLVGLGYFLNGPTRELFKLSYGINAFYLAKSSVRGGIIQENLFENLAYRYHVTHYPVYAAAKSVIQTSSKNYAVTLNAGIGPNFIKTSRLNQTSLDGGTTVPDNAFSGRTSTTFSATAGAGITINQVFGKMPLECGYRFFYLGSGRFNKNSNQILNTLTTGNNYANAVICSVTV